MDNVTYRTAEKLRKMWVQEFSVCHLVVNWLADCCYQAEIFSRDAEKLSLPCHEPKAPDR
jgi:hypothetical protein